jgi:hypothetical protein
MNGVKVVHFFGAVEVYVVPGYTHKNINFLLTFTFKLGSLEVTFFYLPRNYDYDVNVNM